MYGISSYRASALYDACDGHNTGYFSLVLHCEREEKGKRMSNSKKKLIILNIVSVLALLLVVFPLLLISKYNYPSADDWSNGVYGYQVIRSGGGFWKLCVATAKSVKETYLRWDGRFGIALFSSLQPGIWGEKYYGIVAYLILGMLIFSEIVLCKFFINFSAKKQNNLYTLPIIIPALIMQILYSPFPEESIYWYTAAINYTFVYGLSLLLIVLFLKLAVQQYPIWKYILLAILTSIMAILVGGNNFSTSLSCFLSLCLLCILFLFIKRNAFYRTWFVTAFMGISLIICILAPGNANRINSNFGGVTGNAFEAIWMSLVRSAINVYSLTLHTKMPLMLVFVVPFIWMAVKNMEYKFHMPALFTIMTFGLYASQCTATMYVNGTTGRADAILFYSYVIWIIGNIFYWLGWLSKSKYKLSAIMDMAADRLDKFLLLYCALVGCALVILIYRTDLRNITSYKAYRNWRQGWAQQYAAEWDARIEILRDDSVKEVEFAPLTVCPEMLIYTDLQEETGYYWVNNACAIYYGKTYIHIVKPQEQ